MAKLLSFKCGVTTCTRPRDLGAKYQMCSEHFCYTILRVIQDKYPGNTISYQEVYDAIKYPYIDSVLYNSIRIVVHGVLRIQNQLIGEDPIDEPENKNLPSDRASD